jgi:hypothetical protein
MVAGSQHINKIRAIQTTTSVVALQNKLHKSRSGAHGLRSLFVDVMYSTGCAVSVRLFFDLLQYY